MNVPFFQDDLFSPAALLAFNGAKTHLFIVRIREVGNRQLLEGFSFVTEHFTESIVDSQKTSIKARQTHPNIGVFERKAKPLLTGFRVPGMRLEGRDKSQGHSGDNKDHQDPGSRGTHIQVWGDRRIKRSGNEEKPHDRQKYRNQNDTSVGRFSMAQQHQKQRDHRAQHKRHR